MKNIEKNEMERFNADGTGFFNIFDVIKAYIVKNFSIGNQSCKIEKLDENSKHGLNKLTILSDGMVQFQALVNDDYLQMGSSFVVLFIGNKKLKKPTPMSLGQIKKQLLK